MMVMVQTFDTGYIHHRARWALEDTTVLDLDTNELSPLKCSCSWRVFQQVEPFFCLRIRNRIQNTKSIKIYANIQTSADSIFDLIFFCSPLLPFDGFARLRVPMGEGTIELSDSGHTAHWTFNTGHSTLDFQHYTFSARHCTQKFNTTHCTLHWTFVTIWHIRHCTLDIQH